MSVDDCGVVYEDADALENMLAAPGDKWAIFRVDTMEVIHVATSEIMAEHLATALSKSEQYRDVPISWCFARMEE